jgi:hypothetical protein
MKRPSVLVPRRRRRDGWLAALAAMTFATVGCQSFAPRDMSKLASSGDDKRVVKLAKADPFPSPADVGLEPATAVTK